MDDYKIQLVIDAQNKATAEINKLQKQIDWMKSSTTSAMSSIKSAIAWLWLTAMITSATKSIINLWDNLEKAKISFTTMLWSVESAEALLWQLSDFASKTPFELTGIRENAKQLLAMWIQAEEIVPTLKALWDVSAWLNVPLERLALNYGQVITQWKLTWKELKDFTTAGVPLLDELSASLWRSKTEIQDMVSKGQISSQDMVKAFQSMTSEGWKFADLMSKQSDTLSWKRSNMNDSLEAIGETIGESLTPILKSYVDQANARIEENKENIINSAQAWYEAVATAIDTTITAFKVVWNAINTVAEAFGSMIESGAETNASWVSSMMWNRSDFFYFVNQGITAIAKSLNTLLKTANSLWKVITKKDFWSWIYESGMTNKTWREWIKDSRNKTTEYLKNSMKPVADTREETTNDLYQSLEDNYVNRVSQVVSSANNSMKKSFEWFDFGTKTIQWLSESLAWSGGSGGSGWKSLKQSVEEVSEDAKAMQDAIEQLDKELEAQHELARKNAEALYKEYWTALDKTASNIEKLSGEIVKLQDKMNEIWVGANEDLAKIS